MVGKLYRHNWASGWAAFHSGLSPLEVQTSWSGLSDISQTQLLAPTPTDTLHVSIYLLSYKGLCLDIMRKTEYQEVDTLYMHTSLTLAEPAHLIRSKPHQRLVYPVAYVGKQADMP